MSCACENMKKGRELDRIYRLAKAYAVMEDVSVCIYKKTDGTYEFCPLSNEIEIDNEIIEYITPY